MFVKKVFQLVKPFLANLHSTSSNIYSYMYSMTPSLPSLPPKQQIHAEMILHQRNILTAEFGMQQILLSALLLSNVFAFENNFLSNVFASI